MNSIIITKLSQLTLIEESPILLTGQYTLEEEETSSNMWTISFGKKLGSIVTPEIIKKFISSVIKNRQLQVSHLNTSATFYLWHDIQTAELRFNLISGTHSKLPFNCIVELEASFDPIVDAFIRSINDSYIPWDELELLTPEDLNDEEEETPYILKVFCLFLNP